MKENERRRMRRKKRTKKNNNKRGRRESRGGLNIDVEGRGKERRRRE